MRIPKQNYDDIERIIEFDFVRATEAAALNALPWLGRGEKEKADAAACDAIRGMFDLMNICGEVVIGEGIKDEAPGIFKGEQLGTWLPGAPQFDIALDPIDGTTNIAKGRAQLDHLHRGGEPGKGSQGRAPRYSVVLHDEAGLRPGRHPQHEDRRDRNDQARKPDRGDAHHGGTRH